MVEDEGRDPKEKFEFDAAGQAMGYISMDQARLLAMRTARDSPGAYGRRFGNVPMAFEVVVEEETEDHYAITLSFRPEGAFTGTPGQEQFFVAKEGVVAYRQVMALPLAPRGGRLLVAPIAIAVAVMVIGATVGLVYVTVGFGGNGEGPATLLSSTATPTLAVEPEPTPVQTSAVEPEPTPIQTSAVAPEPAPVQTSTQIPVAVSSIGMTLGAKISGSVYEGDGRTPLAKVRVFAEDYQTGNWMTSTNAKPAGSYTLTVPSGTYAVKACATCEQVGKFVDQYFGGGSSPRRQDAIPVSVEAPGSSDDVDFILDVGGTISGRVYGTAEQLPIAGVKVFIEDRQTEDWIGAVHTDQDGRYSLSLLSRTYLVEACPNCSSTEGYLDQWYGSGPSPRREDASPVLVTAPDLSGDIDFTLETGGSLSGRIVRASGRTPIADLHVFVLDLKTDDWIAGTETRSDGSYTLNLPSGTYTVRACPACGRLSNLVAQWYKGAVGRRGATPVRVSMAELSPNIDFFLDAGAAISGRVIDGQTGLPVPGMQAMARFNERNISETKTGRDGCYTLQGVPDGEIQVSVFGRGYVERRRHVTVRESQDVKGIDF